MIPALSGISVLAVEASCTEPKTAISDKCSSRPANLSHSDTPAQVSSLSLKFVRNFSILYRATSDIASGMFCIVMF